VLRQVAVARKRAQSASNDGPGSVKREATGASSSGGEHRSSGMNCPSGGLIRSRGARGVKLGKKSPARWPSAERADTDRWGHMPSRVAGDV
jgi:hypothetical protein